MSYYEIGPVNTKRGQVWELWENNGDIDGRPLAVDLGAFDAPRLCALLNLTRKDSGGVGEAPAVMLMVLSDEELRHLIANAGRELIDRTEARKFLGPVMPYTDDDTIDALEDE